MIHEAMILEYSGRHLALVEWAAGMKLFLFLTLLSNLFFPWGVALANTPSALFDRFSCARGEALAVRRGHCACWKQRSPSFAFSACLSFWPDRLPSRYWPS